MRSIIPFLVVALAASAPALAAENIPVSAFSSLELRGGGEVLLRPGPVQRVTLIEGSSQFTNVRMLGNRRLRIDACNARCPHRYRLRVVVEGPMVPTLAVNGGGTIAAAPGFVAQRELTVAVGGGGAIDVRAVPTYSVTAAVSGGGIIKTTARSALTAAVNGGGEIRYWGNPAVTMAINGGGAVRPGS